MALFGMWCIVAVPFFFATWEEYHTGTLVLPIVNGPSEGVYTTVVSYFATAIVSTLPGSECGYAEFCC